MSGNKTRIQIVEFDFSNSGLVNEIEIPSITR